MMVNLGRVRNWPLIQDSSLRVLEIVTCMDGHLGSWVLLSAAQAARINVTMIYLKQMICCKMSFKAFFIKASNHYHPFSPIMCFSIKNALKTL